MHKFVLYLSTTMKKEAVNKVNEKKILHKMVLGNERFNQVEQGCFDGRFRTKVVPSAKVYSRNIKHKLNNN